MYSVIWKGKPLMPCSKQRAKAMVKSGKAVFVKDKILGTYVKLKKAPSGEKIQRLVLGVDTGTMFTGFSVVGENASVNIEFEHTRKKNDKNCIKKQTETKKMYRRLKRGRLRHREARFLNRTGHKTTYTENYYYQNIRNMIDRICKFYPISDIIIEDVRSVHNTENPRSGFSPIEQIKTKLYKHCSTKANLWISRANPKKIRGFNLAHIRRVSNSSIKDVDFKTEDKSEKTFYAHCLDSHSLACMLFGKHLWYTENILYIARRYPNIDKNRRNLRREMAVRGAKERRPSKLKKIRTKIDDKQGNHGPWNYEYTEQQSTKSTRISPYGTSIKISNSHCENCKKGDNKYKTEKGFEYYNVQYIKPSEVSNNVSYYISYEIPIKSFGRIAKYS